MQSRQVAEALNAELRGHAAQFESLLNAGFDAHLVKPLDYDAMTRLLAGVKSN